MGAAPPGDFIRPDPDGGPGPAQGRRAVSRERSEIGEVIADHGRSARVKMRRGSQCAACSCAGICSPFGKEWMVVTAQNPLRAAAGQRVRVTYRAEGEAKASAILYLIPVLALVLGAALGPVIVPIRNTDAAAAGVGLLFLAISFWLIRIYAARTYGRDPSYEPVISEVMAEPDDTLR